MTVKKEPIPSRYLEQSSPTAPFHLQHTNELYEYFLNNPDNDIHFKWHHYFPIYHKHFSRYKNTPVNILEIGAHRGGSLKMWKKYFGQNAHIFGVEINEEFKKYENLKENIEILIGDQSDPIFLRALMKTLPKIDILIDDGGHTTNQQITTFLECYDKISDNGVYLCEDVHTNYWPDFIDSQETFIDFAKRHIDYLNAWFFNEDANHRFDYRDTEYMPIFTNITHSITFYNSVVVFEKERVVPPVAECR